MRFFGIKILVWIFLNRKENNKNVNRTISLNKSIAERCLYFPLYGRRKKNARAFIFIELANRIIRVFLPPLQNPYMKGKQKKISLILFSFIDLETLRAKNGKLKNLFTAI